MFIKTAFIWIIFPIAWSNALQPPVTDMAIAPDGISLVTCSQAGVQVYRLPSMKKGRSLAIEMRNVRALAFSPNGSTLAVGGGDPAQNGRIVLYDWKTFKRLKTIDGHDDTVSSLCWIGDNHLLTGARDRVVHLWDIRRDKSMQTFRGHSRSVTSMVLCDSERLVTGSEDQSLRVWDIKSGRLLRSLNQHTQKVTALARCPKKEGLPIVASCGADKTVRFWQPTIGRMVRYVRLPSQPLDLAWTSDNRIAVACSDGRVHLVDTDEVRVLKKSSTINGWVYAVTHQPKSGKVVLGGSGGIVQFATWPKN